MEACWACAFAAGCLASVYEFHLSRHNTDAPDQTPINHVPRPPTRESPHAPTPGKLTPAYHAKTLTNENVCFKHCDFLTVPLRTTLDPGRNRESDPTFERT